MKTRDHSMYLRRALLANAGFSTISGLVLLVGAGPLETPLGTPAVALRITGATLLPFAFALWRNARRTRIVRAEARVAVLLDLAWVVGSALLILGQLLPIQTAGKWIVGAVAFIVLAFAVMQSIGLRRLGPSLE